MLIGCARVRISQLGHFPAGSSRACRRCRCMLAAQGAWRSSASAHFICAAGRQQRGRAGQGESANRASPYHGPTHGPNLRHKDSERTRCLLPPRRPPAAPASPPCPPDLGGAPPGAGQPSHRTQLSPGDQWSAHPPWRRSHQRPPGWSGSSGPPPAVLNDSSHC